MLYLPPNGCLAGFSSTTVVLVHVLVRLLKTSPAGHSRDTATAAADTFIGSDKSGAATVKQKIEEYRSIFLNF